jgi:hypothetical protein
MLGLKEVSWYEGGNFKPSEAVIMSHCIGNFLNRGLKQLDINAWRDQWQSHPPPPPPFYILVPFLNHANPLKMRISVNSIGNTE